MVWVSRGAPLGDFLRRSWRLGAHRGLLPASANTVGGSGGAPQAGRLPCAETQPRPKASDTRSHTGPRIHASRRPRGSRACFNRRNYNADDPLSAKSYQQWRDGLAAKTDEVAVVPESYRIRTMAPEGAIAVASLTLRGTDLRPVEGRFEFRNREWVELTEVSEASTRDDGIVRRDER